MRFRSDFRLTDYIPYQVSILAGLIRSGLGSEIDRRFGLNIAEWRVMMTVGAFSPVTTKTISDHTTTAKAEISRAVTRLVKDGVLVRVVDPRDKRKVLLWFSEEGADLHRRLQDFAVEWEDQMLSVLSDTEHEQLMDLLTRLRAHLTHAMKISETSIMDAALG